MGGEHKGFGSKRKHIRKDIACRFHSHQRSHNLRVIFGTNLRYSSSILTNIRHMCYFKLFYNQQVKVGIFHSHPNSSRCNITRITCHLSSICSLDHIKMELERCSKQDMSRLWLYHSFKSHHIRRNKWCIFHWFRSMFGTNHWLLSISFLLNRSMLELNIYNKSSHRWTIRSNLDHPSLVESDFKHLHTNNSEPRRIKCIWYSFFFQYF